MEDGAAILRTDWQGGRWLEGWEIGIKLPCGRFPHIIYLDDMGINKLRLNTLLASSIYAV
jgi:hypothetical protein